MRLLKSSYQAELDRFFDDIAIKEKPLERVSKSAFTQARRKLKHTAFTELSQTVIDDFYLNAPKVERWKGHRIIAMDGSTLEIPKSQETIDHFGLYKTKGEYNTIPVMARVNLAYDVLNQVIISSGLFPFRTAEPDQAISHLDKLSKGDICILDRGFDGFWFMSLLKSEETDFCIRMKTGTWNKAKQMIKKGQKDIITNLYAANKAVINCKERNLSRDPLKVRLVHCKLKTGEDMVLATSLMDQEKYPTDSIIELYKMRWMIEERIKFLKERLQIGKFSGRTVLSAYQDFHAKIFMANYASVLTTQAQAGGLSQYNQMRKKKYQLNRTRAVARVRDYMLDLMKGINVKIILNSLLNAFIKAKEIIKPGRSFPRNHYPPNKHHNNYKPA